MTKKEREKGYTSPDFIFSRSNQEEWQNAHFIYYLKTCIKCTCSLRNLSTPLKKKRRKNFKAFTLKYI